MPRPPYRKRFGQHHLRDAALCRPLVEFLRPRGERVVEVGPGGGVLTRALADAGARVLACELDLDWAFHLRPVLPTAARLAVVDALDLDWRRLPAGTLVAGNLPFNVGTRIVEDLLGSWPAVPRAAFMLQKEVAERLVAAPGDPAYGALSAIVRAHAEPRLLATVKPGSFVPPPKVAAAFVGLTLRAPPFPPAEDAAFRAVVRLAFGQRRKTLRNALRAAWPAARVAAVLTAAGIDGGRRAESLALDELVALHRADRTVPPA